MARRFSVLLFALALLTLALVGCGAPETQAERADDNGHNEGPAKDKSRAEKEASEKRAPRTEEADEPKPESKPKPAPEPKPKPEPAPKPEPPDRSKPRPEPAPSGDATASATASASASPSPSVSGGDYDATVTVSRVVDGDTVEISPAVDGNEEVRLIGMDTPETKDPSEGVEPYGPEASEFATDELTGQTVGLEFDAERTDQYGRLLAYVYVGGGMFNEDLVEGGYAQAYPYEPNTRYAGRFAAAQEEARAAGLGIWGLSLAQQCQLADRGNGIGEGTPGCSESSATSTASASPPASASASTSSSASAGLVGGAPVPSEGDIDCDQVNGPIPTPAGDPDGLDGDGDGLACE